jgi:hypothetical protein
MLKSLYYIIQNTWAGKIMEQKWKMDNIRNLIDIDCIENSLSCVKN